MSPGRKGNGTPASSCKEKGAQEHHGSTAGQALKQVHPELRVRAADLAVQPTRYRMGQLPRPGPRADLPRRWARGLDAQSGRRPGGHPGGQPEPPRPAGARLPARSPADGGAAHRPPGHHRTHGRGLGVAAGAPAGRLRDRAFVEHRGVRPAPGDPQVDDQHAHRCGEQNRKPPEDPEPHAGANEVGVHGQPGKERHGPHGR